MIPSHLGCHDIRLQIIYNGFSELIPTTTLNFKPWHPTLQHMNILKLPSHLASHVSVQLTYPFTIVAKHWIRYNLWNVTQLSISFMMLCSLYQCTSTDFLHLQTCNSKSRLNSRQLFVKNLFCLTLSVPHVTIVSLSCLVNKCPCRNFSVPKV